MRVRRTCMMWGMARTMAPTSKSPTALERHRPPGHTLRGPHPCAVGPLAGPEPAKQVHSSQPPVNFKQFALLR